MKKLMVLILMVIAGISCKCTNCPSDLGKTYDTVEFMYQRAGIIVTPQFPDPECFILMYGSGGENIHITQTEVNQWRGERALEYNINSQNPYRVRSDDGKVALTDCARDVFARVKGSQQGWIKLDHLREEWAVFRLNKNGIYFPE